MAFVNPTNLSTTLGKLADLVGAQGFSAHDLAWERCNEQAAEAFAAGDAAAAARHWEKALTIAEKHFVRGDPRLAASLTNHALVMRRRRQDYQAKASFADALKVWDEAWRWVHLMTPAGSAPTAHAERLEVYDAEARAVFSALVARGRKATEILERDDRLLTGGLDEWRQIKPKRMTDLRKLLAAVLLIASKTGAAAN